VTNEQETAVFAKLDTLRERCETLRKSVDGDAADETRRAIHETRLYVAGLAWDGTTVLRKVHIEAPVTVDREWRALLATCAQHGIRGA
jgi:hypothetical protein